MGTIFPQAQQSTGSYGRVNLNSNMPIIGPLLSVVPPDQRTAAFSNWFYGFNLSWELDLWGRIRRNIESNNAALDASVETYDDALVTLLADVAASYAQYRIAQPRIKIARDNVRIQGGILVITQERFRVGATNRLDVEQATTVLEQTRSSIPALQIALGQATDTLCILLGMPPHDLEPVLGPGPELGNPPMPNTPAWVATGIPADLVHRRPDVRSAERLVAAQSAQIGVAEAALYPTIAVNGTIGWDAQDLNKLFEAKSFISGLALARSLWTRIRRQLLARSFDLPVRPSCCGACRSTTSESAVIPSATPGSRSMNAWPARPRQAAVRHILGPVPLRAFHRVPSDAGVRADHVVPRPATNRAAVLLIETDSISLIGPNGSASRGRLGKSSSTVCCTLG